ncbi:MAG: tetratricopeptide repeat protein [Deltaproteobacteria bacterium]|nr:MAG: tetratricopeptide repeat protein [Deltaproteobacteria bacterium]
MSAGKLDDARVWFDKVLRVRKLLAAADATNTTWQRDLSVSYKKLGDVAMSADKLDDARAWFDKALAVHQALVAAHPSSTDLQRDLCTILAEIAQVARDPNEATRYLGDARTIYGRLQRAGFFQGDIAFAQLGAALDRLTAQLGTAPRR